MAAARADDHARSRPQVGARVPADAGKIGSDVAPAGTPPEVRVGEKFRVGAKLGSGSFGNVYLGSNVITGEEVAIKMERTTAKHPQLPSECRAYIALGSAVGVPRVHWYGVDKGCNTIVMDLLGPSLEDLFRFCGKRFSLKTALMLGYQMLQRIERLHMSGFIHRDLKPDNFVIGLGCQANCVHLIDLGLARRYVDPETKKHVPLSAHKDVAGTACFASINAHLGVQQSRRDDLESLGYVLLYFLHGSLPWQRNAAVGRKHWRQVFQSKNCMALEDLCWECPVELMSYMTYVRKLRFDEAPDYDHLRGLLLDAFQRWEYTYDYVFDWTLRYLARDQGSNEQEAEESDSSF